MDIVLRAAFAFGFVLFLTRVLGRKELSSLEPVDLVLLIVIGDLIQQGVTQSDYSVTGLVLAVTTIGLLQAGTSWVTFRFPRVRRVVDGEPIVVIQDGKVFEKNLRRERVTLEAVAEEMRTNGIAHVEEVAWAVMETSGKITFVKKQAA
jgi:uncharacterized membrane protein YcaP (DUF421 family)